MSHFENGVRDSVDFSLGGETKTAAQLAAEKSAREGADREAAEFLAEQKKKRDAVDFAERRRAQTRAAELLKAEVVEIVMQENPNFDETDAKILYENELKKIIAIERFKKAYFGKKPTTFGDVQT